MVPYYIPNSYSAQIEGTGINFRFRYTCFGIAPRYSFWRRTVRELPLWYRLFFGWSFGFWYHTGQKGQWNIFSIELGALQVWYRTKGDSKDEYTGFHVSLNTPKKGWRKVI